MAEGAQHFLDSFKDPEAVARYTEGPKRFVPGLDGLHRMTGLLLAERVPADAHILVLGAGGGSEMKAMAEAHPGWRFTGARTRVARKLGMRTRRGPGEQKRRQRRDMARTGRGAHHAPP